jgi:hypothetical protein
MISEMSNVSDLINVSNYLFLDVLEQLSLETKQTEDLETSGSKPYSIYKIRFR